MRALMEKYQPPFLCGLAVRVVFENKETTSVAQYIHLCMQGSWNGLEMLGFSWEASTQHGNTPMG